MKTIVFLFSLLILSASCLAQPMAIMRNAMTTNVAGVPVISRADLSITNHNSATNWIFYGFSSKTVARLGDITHVASGANTIISTDAPVYTVIVKTNTITQAGVVDRPTGGEKYWGTDSDSIPGWMPNTSLSYLYATDTELSNATNGLAPRVNMRGTNAQMYANTVDFLIENAYGVQLEVDFDGNNGVKFPNGITVGTDAALSQAGAGLNLSSTVGMTAPTFTGILNYSTNRTTGNNANLTLGNVYQYTNATTTIRYTTLGSASDTATEWTTVFIESSAQQQVEIAIPGVRAIDGIYTNTVNTTSNLVLSVVRYGKQLTNCVLKVARP